MYKKTLLSLNNINTRKTLFLSSVAQARAANDIDKRLRYYRNLNASEKQDVDLQEWNKARPYESIPGPKPSPIIGNTWRFWLPKIGDFYGLDNMDIHKKLHKEYGNIAILRHIAGRKPLIFLFNPRDIETLQKQEGVWPLRAGFPALRAYRQLRKQFLPLGGLLTTDGEEWFKLRTLINPVLMHQKTITQYTAGISLVADQLVDNIRHFSVQNNQGEMPEDFEFELYKWSLESVGLVMMDKHLGVLNRNNENSDHQTLINAVLTVFDTMYTLDVLSSIWKYVTTPSFRKFVKASDTALRTTLKHVNQRLDEIKNEEVSKNTDDFNSVLCQLAKVDRNVAVTWSAEMLLTGVDTTAKTLAAALYYISKNPEKQELLRNEAKSLLPNKDSPVTKEILSKALYTRAALKETTRLATIAVGILRTTKKDMVLGDYQVPAGVHVQSSNLLLCTKDEYFPRANEFIPERWLSTTTGELSYKNTNRSVYSPFGYGPRICMGKRLATLELEIALLKVARNFELKWPHKDMVFKTLILHGIAKPLKIHVKET